MRAGTKGWWLGLVLAGSLLAPARAQQGFTQIGTLPDSFYAHRTEANRGFLYHLGGISGYNGVYDGDKVFVARITSPGHLGEWMPAAPLPELVFYHASAVWNDALYVIGGYRYEQDGTFTISNAVYFSRLGADGQPGVWVRAANLPKSLYLHAAAVCNGVVYVSGGWSDGGQESGVYGGAIDANGNISSWTPLTALPTGIYAHTTVKDATVYVLGGVIDNGARIQNNVYYAPILADKSLGAWHNTTPLPEPLANHVSEVVAGAIWTIGGWTGAAATTRVDHAAILADHSLGAWQPGPPLPAGVVQHAAAVVSDALYVTGGLDQDNTVHNEIWYLPPSAPPAPVDQLPPRTTLAWQGPSYSSGTLFVSPETTFSLSAADDRSAVGDGLGVGVSSTQWAQGDGAFGPYAAPFKLSAEGAYSLRYFSSDLAGNQEPAQWLAAAVDATAPASTLAIGAPKAVLSSARTIVAASTLLAVSATDPVSNGVASGIAEVLAAADGAPLAPSAASFSLPPSDGPHMIRHQARDQVGNLEEAVSETVYLDNTPPATTLSADPAPHLSADGPILGATGLLRFSAQDPVAGGVAAGVNATLYSLDGGPAVPAAGSLALAEGVHTLRFRSIDNVANAEAWQSAAYRLDATAPATTLTVASPVMRVDGQDVVTPTTPLTLSAIDPQSAGVASGVKSTVYRVDAAADRAYAGAFSLSTGTHVVRYHSVDNAGNVEPERAVTFTVQAMDGLPPRTSYAIEGPAWGAGPVFASGASSFSLGAVDDRSSVGDAAGVGVAATFWAFDAQAFATYQAALAAPVEGSHWFRFYSVDNAGNIEAAQALQVAVDATPPVSALAIGAPQATLASGAVVVSSRTPLAASAQDSLVSGVASGVSTVLVALDGSPPAELGEAFTLPATDGPHTVSVQAKDNVGNTEAARVTALLLDQTPPVTTVSASPEAYTSSEGTILGAAAQLTLLAADPTVNGAAAGVARTELALDGAAPAPAGAALKLTEGEHVLAVRSVDNVGNEEAWREARYRVDATAPLTALETGSPVMRLSGEEVLTPETPLTLSAEDPVSAGVASGVGATVYRVDDGEEQSYGGPFRLTAGRHTVRWHSADRAGNVEQERSAAFAVEALDKLPPRTALSVIGAHLGADPLFVRPDTAFSLAAIDDRQAAGDAAGVGVASTRWAFDDAAFAAYAGAFPAPASGAHWLRYTSADLLGNAEPAAAVSIAVDGAAPVSRIVAGAPQAVLESGDVILASTTLLSVSAEDPAIDGVASGVAELLVAVDGGGLRPAAATFRLPAADGAHTVLHRATDNLGNVETERGETFFVDRTPPATTVSVTPEPYVSAQGPILGAAALVTFSAADPAVNGAAAGVHHTEHSVDATAAATGGAVALEEGAHVLAYRSVDNVGNAEGWLQAAYKVDATPPLTTLETGSPVIRLFGRDIVTAATPLSVSAEDPVSAGVASGVRSILYAVDAGAEQAYAGPFHLPAGPHTVTYRSIDNAGNSEEARTAGFEVGTFPIDSIAALDSAALNGGASVTGQVRANGAFTAGGKSTVTGDVTAATVSLTGKSGISGTTTRTAGTVSAMDAAALRAAAAANNDNASAPWLADGPLVLASQAVRTLPAGSYFVTALQLSGGASLSVSGPVNLFVAGPISVTGGATLNQAGSADDLWIFTDGANATIAGGARSAAHLIAPNAAVAFSGGGAVAGRVLGRTVSLSGNAVHPSDSALPALARSPGQAKKLTKASTPAGSTAGKGHGSGGAEAVVRSRLAPELPPAGGVSRAQARAPSPREALPAPAATQSMLAASAKRSAQAPQGKPEAVLATKVSTAGPAVRHAQLEPAAPAASAKGTASAGAPAVERERLPAPPAAASRLLERMEHEAPAEPAALARRAAEPDAGTAGPATADGLAQPVRAALLDAAQPQTERTGARAPRLAPPARHEAAARRVEARMPPLMTARLAALSVVTRGRTGAVRSGARHAVLVPEGAVKASLALTVSTERRLDDGERERRDRAAVRKEATAVGQAVAYGPEGTRFDKPVTLELAYDRALLPAGVSERALAVHYWNPRSGEWEALASEVDVQAQVVRAKTNHFSTYQLLAVPTAGGPAAPGALLGDVYPFPNPVRPGQTAKLRIQSAADRLEIRIYDVAGELKHSAAYDHPAAELDHVWDLSGVGSGVYIYSVTASRAGERPARARGKVGVIQ